MSKKLIVGITAEGSVGLLHGQLRYFKEKGYQTYLLAPLSKRSEAFCIKEGCTHLQVDIEREISISKDMVTLYAIFKLFLKVKPDIINLGTPKVSLLGMIAGKVLGVRRRIYTCRGFRFEHEQGMKKKILKLMEKITGACAHKIICISPSVRDLGVKEGLFDERKCVVINKGSSNGIDLKQFDPQKVSAEAKAALREKLQLQNKFVFGFLGRIIDRKGVSELFDAFCKCYEQDKSVRLLIVGPVEKEQLKDPTLMDRIEAHEAVIWPGRTDNVPLYLSVMDLFALPAWWEGFGNVLIQAAAMGIPVISTRATGSMDAVSDGYNGILIEPKNTEQLYHAMKDLRNNPDQLKRFSLNGIEWAKHFDNAIIWSGMERIYND